MTIGMNNLGKNGRMGNQMFQYAALFGIAKQCGFEGVVLPFSKDYELIFIDDCNDSDYINEVAFECGLEEFVFVDFINKKEKVYCVYDVA